MNIDKFDLGILQILQEDARASLQAISERVGLSPTPCWARIKRMEAEAPTVKVSFKVGERVRIVDGPFNDFRGVVSEIDMERTKVRVMVSFFGRETPVELDFLQVEKL